MASRILLPQWARGLVVFAASAVGVEAPGRFTGSDDINAITDATIPRGFGAPSSCDAGVWVVARLRQCSIRLTGAFYSYFTPRPAASPSKFGLNDEALWSYSTPPDRTRKPAPDACARDSDGGFRGQAVVQPDDSLLDRRQSQAGSFGENELAFFHPHTVEGGREAADRTAAIQASTCWYRRREPPAGGSSCPAAPRWDSQSSPSSGSSPCRCCPPRCSCRRSTPC